MVPLYTTPCKGIEHTAKAGGGSQQHHHPRKPASKRLLLLLRLGSPHLAQYLAGCSISCVCSLAPASAALRAAAGPGSRPAPVPNSTAKAGRAAPAGTNPRRMPFWQGYTHARSCFEALARRAMVAAAPRKAEPRAITSAARPQRVAGRSMAFQPLCMLRRVQGSRCTTVRRRAETWRQGPAAQLATASGRCCSSF
jgi:hypothetical protein